MAKGYTSRMLRAGISRHTVTTPTLPDLTPAEYASRVYTQRWQSLSVPQACAEFAVLALDPTHAHAVGERQLERMQPGTLGDVRLVENREALYWDASVVEGLMATEPFAEREERRARYAAQEMAS